MKMAPILEQLRLQKPEWSVKLIHTGQHYDQKLSDLFFQQLQMPQPDVNLGIGSGTHARQTSMVMMALEELFLAERPDLVLVAGDINSTLAAALVAAKLQIKLAHVEAGLRSFDRSMPEEINRILTDTISDIFFTTEPQAQVNLINESIPTEKIFFVGNTMIDTLLHHLEEARRLDMAARLGLTSGHFALVTLHRPANVDDPATLRRVMNALIQLAENTPVIFPVHPRTAARLQQSGLGQRVGESGNLKLLEPLGYLEFIGLMDQAGVVITDSGGIQEETVILGKPCITFRTTTERPITLESGLNVLVGDDTELLLHKALSALETGNSVSVLTPEKWDGRAADRIVKVLATFLP